ncbi:hypothetical protein V8G54_015588, partial [Vigna mungo]
PTTPTPVATLRRTKTLTLAANQPPTNRRQCPQQQELQTGLGRQWKSATQQRTASNREYNGRAPPSNEPRSPSTPPNSRCRTAVSNQLIASKVTTPSEGLSS